ncbi:MAG: DNA topoisomerase IB [Pedobacter sp.]|uniref:DNA topoisomerase IB n=1 Tax=Pedobacter sp. TaxID=1411316 RepID=UPI003568EBF6
MIETREVIKENGLVYVTDSMPGIYRKGKSGTFFYEDAKGAQIKDEIILQRIAALVLPPAWTSVWISPKANGYLQATGIDNANRKQYKYHSKWIKRRAEHKYFRLLEFGKALPNARKRIEKDLRRKELDELKVLAVCVDLLQKTLLRVGGKAYMQQYGSIGLSTLKDKHVKINGSALRLTFIGKKGVQHEVNLTDRRLARLVKKCRDIAGQELFQYYNGDGVRRSIDSGQINNYIKEITDNDFTAKDFRTWGGTLEALKQFAVCFNSMDEQSKAKIEVQVLDCVAKKLGNTRAICKSSYVYPVLLEAYRNDRLDKWLKKIDTSDYPTQKTLENNERVLLSFLKHTS